MPPRANEILKNAVSESALKQSAIPVFICDGDFRLCEKSIGAKSYFKRPALNCSVLPNLPEEAVLGIQADGEPRCVNFKTPSGDAFAILTAGEVVGQKYYAVVFEPRIMFVPSPKLWYVAESYKNLSEAVEELISSPKKEFARLSKCCMQVLRLSDILQVGALEDMPAADIADAYLELKQIANIYSEHLNKMGAAVRVFTSYDGIMTCLCKKGVMHISFAVLLAAAVMISENGLVEMECDFSDDTRKYVDVVTSVSLRAGEKVPESFSELCDYIHPLRPELAAIMDISENYSIGLDCGGEAGKLKITARFKAEKTSTLYLREPIDLLPLRIHGIIAGLGELAAEYRRKQA